MSVFITATTDPCAVEEITSYIKQLQNAGVDYVHFDVMDGKFVERKILSPEIIKSEIEKNPKIQAVIHLMVDEPQNVVEKYIDCGAKYLIVHYEAFDNKQDLIDCLETINESTTISGVAINPGTPVSVLGDEILKRVGLIMVMGVIPGKSGQTMIDGTLEKIKAISKLTSDKFIACDGGITKDNIQQVIDAGTDFVSTGSLMFNLIKEGTAKKFIEQF